MKNLRINRLLAGTILLYCLCFSVTAFAQVSGNKFENDIKKFNSRDSIENIQPGANLFVGSSSITNWKDIAEYFPKSYVINRGFGGSKFEDLLYFSDRVIMHYKPAKVFIYEGDNDIQDGVSTTILIKQAKELRERIEKALPGVPVVFISAKPSVARWQLKEKYEEFNKMLKDYSMKTKNTEFADVWNPMLDKNGEVFKDIFLQDNLHMKSEGYKIWQRVLAPFLIENKPSNKNY